MKAIKYRSLSNKYLFTDTKRVANMITVNKHNYKFFYYKNDNFYI